MGNWELFLGLKIIFLKSEYPVLKSKINTVYLLLFCLKWTRKRKNFILDCERN